MLFFVSDYQFLEFNRITSTLMPPPFCSAVLINSEPFAQATCIRSRTFASRFPALFTLDLFDEFEYAVNLVFVHNSMPLFRQFSARLLGFTSKMKDFGNASGNRRYQDIAGTALRFGFRAGEGIINLDLETNTVWHRISFKKKEGCGIFPASFIPTHMFQSTLFNQKSDLNGFVESL